MPFTLSHVSVVLPFSRPLARWRLLSAAVIGSMVPDFHILAPWRMGRFETHSAMALLTFCLPVGLMGYWLFQYLIKVPMVEVLPDGAYARWRPSESPASIDSPTQWVLAACGVLGGAVTHLIWDGFTHEGGRGVRMLPMLDEPILDLGRHHMPLTRLMQDAGSLAGLLLMVAIVCYGLRPGKERPTTPRLIQARERCAWYWAILLGGAAFWVAYLVPARLMGFPGVGWLVYDSAIASLRALATAAIVFGAAIQLRLRAIAPSPAYLSSGPER